MADTKKLNLQVTLDKKALDVLKIASKNTIEEIKALSRQAVEQAKQDGRLKVEAEKTTQARIKAETEKRISDDNLNYKRDKDNFTREEKNKREEARRTTDEKKRQEKELTVYDKKYNDPAKFKGQFTSSNSISALDQEIKYYNNLRRTVDVNSQSFTDYTKKVVELRRAKQELGSATVSSKAQLLEFGENLTTVAAGVVAAAYAFLMGAKVVIDFGIQALKSAADLEVYYNKFVELEGGAALAGKQLVLLRQAAAGNLNDTELVKYSNGMRMLGRDSLQTAQFLDFVERQADDAGITFEEGFKAIEKFTTTGATKGLVGIKINLVDVQNEMRRLTGFTDEQIAKMDEEDKQILRTKALLSLYGRTQEEIAQKTKDTGDKIESLSTGFDNIKTTMGSGLIEPFNAVYKVLDNIGISGDKTDKVLKDLTKIIVQPPWYIFAKTLGDINKEFGGMPRAIADIINPIGKLYNILTETEKVFKKIGDNGFGNLKKDYASANSGTVSNTEEDLLRKQTTFREALKNSQIGSDNAKYYSEELKKIDKQLKEINKDSTFSAPKSKDENLFTLQEFLNGLNAEIELEELLNKYHIKTNSQLNETYKLKLNELKANEDLIKVVQKNLSLREKEAVINKNQAEYLIKQTELIEKQKLLTGDELFKKYGTNLQVKIKDDGKGIKGGLDANETKALKDKFATQQAESDLSEKDRIREKWSIMLSGLDNLAGGMSTIWNIFSDRQDTFIAKFLKTFQDTLSIVRSIQMIFEAIKVINEGVSIVKSLIPFLADGGPATAGMPHIVGERGPELFIPNVSGTVISNANTQKILSDAVRSQSMAKAYQNVSSMNVGVKLHDNIKNFIVTTVNEERGYRRGVIRG